MQSWKWLVPPSFTVWFANRIGDVFLVFGDGSVHQLDIGSGTLEKLAESRDKFGNLIDESERANDWFAMPLVDRLVAAGMALAAGQCYGFKKLPVLGGDYVIDNFAPIDAEDWIDACGSIHEQLLGVPDGSEVVIKVKSIAPKERS